MKWGVFLPNQGPLATGPESVERQLAAAQMAEKLGFDSVWATDHIIMPKRITSRYPYSMTGEYFFPTDSWFLEPFSLLGFVAAVTRRVRLGTAVAVLPHRNPIVTAKTVATLDVLSRGRMLFGAGIGWMEEEITILGAPFNKRGALSDEYLRAMRELWTNPDPRFEGRFCSFGGVRCEPKPVQRHLPILIGGHSARAMRRAAELGDGLLAVPKSFAAFQENIAQLKAAAAKVGRDFESFEVLSAPLYVSTVDGLLEEAKRYSALGFDSFLAPFALWPVDFNEVLRLTEDLARKAGL